MKILIAIIVSMWIAGAYNIIMSFIRVIKNGETPEALHIKEEIESGEDRFLWIIGVIVYTIGVCILFGGFVFLGIVADAFIKFIEDSD